MLGQSHSHDSVHEQNSRAKSLWYTSQAWHFDVDHYINHIVAPSPLHRLPTPVSRWFGYRKEKRQDVGNVLGAFWSSVGAFCGLAVIAAVFNNTASIQMHSPPVMIASFGASAILEYNAIRSPLGQPRNALLGHTFSAIIGVGITKLFRLRSDFEKLRWVAGAVSCGVSSAVMLLTGTVHPPGGASAVLAATSPEITEMGWYFVGLVMWGTTLMLIAGLVINNIMRQFPMYWWTPMDLRMAKVEDEEHVPNARGGVERKRTEQEQEAMNEKDKDIIISAWDVKLPDDLSLNGEEAEMLERLMRRLRNGRCERHEETDSARSSADVTMVSSHGERSDRGDQSDSGTSTTIR